ncbi:hypothetical protein Pcinc_031682 [Petrolisthes cinctipes]|uniref:Alpha-1,3-mannosyl-glycoprotein 2-beta-N-acetylglucosaminyltransferase n=1 Tax=Petrolisthes cinctipes TaxID=88211 RepID=A0AAE1K0L9_PETCI|nr:hypothetical protein Pcinc_031682 [Petrolisthes cinctipes]
MSGVIRLVLLLIEVMVMGATSHDHREQKQQQNNHDVSGVSVWSGDSGWGLQVHRYCQLNHHRCNEGMEVTRDGWVDAGEGRGIIPPAQGITITVLNQRTAQLIFSRVFPLRLYWAHWADLDWHMKHIAPGRIVIMAVSVSGIYGLRHASIRLAALGSLFARHLPPTAHWTWVFIMGGRTISETAHINTHIHLPHHVHVLLPLSSIPHPPKSHSRWQYCENHGAMGGLCDEVSPDPLPPPIPSPVVKQDQLTPVPVIVTAGKRHQYLYHTLITLMTTPGAIHHNILVILGDAPASTTFLLHLLNVNYTTLPVYGHQNNKLFRYYRAVFNHVAVTFPNAPAAIFLDEDVEVSPDFFSYFSQTLWLLNYDPSIYCINAHSATGFRGLAHDPSTVLRARVQVSWGYAISLNFIRELITIWPEDINHKDTVLYDAWVYLHASQGRECVFPEVSRTRHYGIGVNTDAWSTEQWFLTQPLVTHSHVHLSNITDLTLKPWQHKFLSTLQHATFLTTNPCLPTFVPSVNTTTYFIFCYALNRKPEGNLNYQNFYFAAKCLNAWGVSEQGLHEGVLTIRTSLLTTVYLVGTPYSPYGYLCPKHILPWSYDELSDDDEQHVVDRIRQHEIEGIIQNNMQVAKLQFGQTA